MSAASHRGIRDKWTGRASWRKGPLRSISREEGMRALGARGRDARAVSNKLYFLSTYCVPATGLSVNKCRRKPLFRGYGASVGG